MVWSKVKWCLQYIKRPPKYPFSLERPVLHHIFFGLRKDPVCPHPEPKSLNPPQLRDSLAERFNQNPKP